jgi:hypothetical protein
MKKRGARLSYRHKSGTGRSTKEAKREISEKVNGGWAKPAQKAKKLGKQLRGVGGTIIATAASIIQHDKSHECTSTLSSNEFSNGLNEYTQTVSSSIDSRSDTLMNDGNVRKDESTSNATMAAATIDSTSSHSTVIDSQSNTQNENNPFTCGITSNSASPTCTTLARPELSTVTPILSTYKQKRIQSARVIEIDRKAFSRKRDGEERSSDEAAKLAKRRCIQPVVEYIKGIPNESQRVMVIEGVLQHSDMAPYVKAVGYVPVDEQEVALFQYQQQREALAAAAATDNPRGRPPDDQSNFIRAVNISNAPGPDLTDAPSKNKRLKTLKNAVSRATGYRMLNMAEKAREQLFSKVQGIRWSTGRSRKGYSKVTKEIQVSLRKWILEHPDVVESPIVNDTLRIWNPLSKKKDQIVPKQLLQISVRELHNDLLKPVEEGGFEFAYTEDGKVLISDTMLRSLLPKEMRRMTERHKQMCGCETCIIGRGLLQSLKAYRTRVLRKMKKAARDMPNGPNKDAAVQSAEAYKQAVCLSTGEMKPTTIQDAIKLVQCPDVAEHGHPKWACVLRRCECCPNYDDSIPAHEERAGSDELTNISFDVYKPYTKCSKHGLLDDKAKTCPKCEATNGHKKKGKIRTKKELTRMTTSISVFHEEYFEPALEALAYH